MGTSFEECSAIARTPLPRPAPPAGRPARGRWLPGLALLLLFLLPLLLLLPLSATALQSSPSDAAVPATAAAPAATAPALVELDPGLFPVPGTLRPNVSFWIDIFTRHTSDHVVIHDELAPGRVYAVMDFTALSASNLSEVTQRKRRSLAVQAEEARIRGALMALAGGRVPSEPDLAAKLPALFADDPNPPAAFRAAAGRIRTQTGLGDQFEEALVRSGRYLPHMEKIFLDRSLPVELSRLPFVESMFQENARSKVAAGGMWQIMPATGRRVLEVGMDVDERFDPFLATEAAATFLSENYAALGAWPLAITAYNYGTNGMARAVRTLGTRDLGKIVEAHQGRSFGFASKNFYSEFVAAAVIYANREHYFPGVTPDPALAFEEFAPQHYVPVAELARQAGTTVSELEPLNPALHTQVWSGQLLVPAGYRLRVPEGQAEAFAVAYEALPADLKMARQAGLRYRVRPGDTLSAIARRYGTSIAAIQQANRLGRKTMIRVGQTLYIPPGRSFASSTIAARAPSTSSPAQTVHIVKRGETLWDIARRYGTTVSALMSLNRIVDAARIHVGQRLKVAP